MEASLHLTTGASVLVGHTVGDVFVVDETMTPATPALLGALMMLVFFGMSGFLMAKAIQAHAKESNNLPIPVTRIAGSDTIEDIFKLRKRSASRARSPSTPPERQKRDEAPGRLATPPLVPSSASPSELSPLTPDDDALSTPIMGPIPARSTAPAVQTSRRVFRVLNRSPSDLDADNLETDDGSYLRYPGARGYWPSPDKGGVARDENVVYGWVYSAGEDVPLVRAKAA